MNKLITLVLLIAALVAIAYGNAIILNDYVQLKEVTAAYNGAPGQVFAHLSDPGIIQNEMDVLIEFDVIGNITFGGVKYQQRNGLAAASLDASIKGYFLYVYDGADALPNGDTSNARHPCGSGTFGAFTLASTQCNSPTSSLASLNLNLEGKFGMVFVVVSHEQPLGFTNMTFRLWDNFGGSMYRTVDIPRADDSSPITLFLPFNRFIGYETFNMASVRAIAHDSISTTAADLVFTPFSMIGYDIEKRLAAGQENNQYTAGSETVWEVVVDTDDFPTATFENNLVFNVKIEDILDEGFADFDITRLTITDRITNIPIIFTVTAAGRAATIDFAMGSGGSAVVRYVSTVATPFIDCNRQICNNANLTVTTSATFIENNVTIRTFDTRSFLARKCIVASANPVLTVNYESCPAEFANNRQTNARVCNSGNGPAQNVVLTQDVSSGCTAVPAANQPNVVCNNQQCVKTISSLAAGTCSNMVINFDCSQFATSCVDRAFSYQLIAREGCRNATSNIATCSFSSNPTVVVDVTKGTTLANPVPAKIGESISFTINVKNEGDPVRFQGYRIQEDYPLYTTPDAATRSSWICNTTQRMCYTEVAEFFEERNFNFVVTVNDDIPISTQQVCNNVRFTTTTTATTPNGCVATDTASACADVAPGIPDITVTKDVSCSRLTYYITATSKGTGPVNNLILRESLQPGWSLSAASRTLGWVCLGSSCSLPVGNVPIGQTITREFSVDVARASQEGNTKCWENVATVSFDDGNLDPTPSDNSDVATIGNQCQSCCEVPACPDPNVTVTSCPAVTCNCEVPEYWCPPCQKAPAACSCETCSDVRNVVFGTISK